MLKNKLIVIEGLDGAGKSTAAQLIHNYLEQQGVEATDIVYLREPGATKLGEKLRTILKDPESDITPFGEIMLLFASRAQLIKEAILPAIQNNKWIILDRYFYSTLAYQGGGRGYDKSLIKQLINNLIPAELQPTVLFYLKIDAAVGLARVKGYTELDRIEQSGLEFFYNVATEYDNIFAEAAVEHKFAIDAGQELSSVTEDIFQALHSIWQTLD